MRYDVKWAGSRSSYFNVLCGTKQGGILSPDFFSIYINDLIGDLKRLGVGCHIIGIYRLSSFCRRHVVDCANSRIHAADVECLRQLLPEVLSSVNMLTRHVNKTKVMVFEKLSNNNNILSFLFMKICVASLRVKTPS